MMKRKWRYFWLLCAAALGWWTGAGLDYAAGEASQVEPIIANNILLLSEDKLIADLRGGRRSDP